jgi:hypothetical protein
MKRIFVILIYLIVVILFIYTIIKINNNGNDNNKLIVKKPLTSIGSNYVNTCNNISEPTIVLKSGSSISSLITSTNPTFIRSQYYIFDASQSYDYDGTKNLSFYWDINLGQDIAGTIDRNNINNYLSTNYNSSVFTLNSYTFSTSTIFQLILTVKSNYKPFLKKIIIRDIYIIRQDIEKVLNLYIVPDIIYFNINNIPPLTVDNQIHISDRTRNVISGYNYYTTDIKVWYLDGFIVNNDSNPLPFSNDFILYPFKYIPNTKQFLLFSSITYSDQLKRNVNSSKYISIPLILPLNKKFNANLSYNNVFNNKWNYWDIGENATFILNTNVVDNISNKRPNTNELVYKWEIISINEKNNYIRSSNLNSSILTVTYDVDNISNLYYKLYKIICTITFGLFSIPIILETPEYNVIKRDLIGTSTGNYVNYLVYNTSKFNFQYTEYFNSSNQIVGIRINNPLNNFYETSSRVLTQEIRQEFINNSPISAQTSNNVQTITTTTRWLGLFYFKIIKYLDKNIMSIYPISSDNIESTYGVYSYKVIS